MRIWSLLTILALLPTAQGHSQNFPLFGPEKSVDVNGLTFDAMEPFISPDGNTMFFNSLNSGGNTNLHYATRVDDTTFNYVGLLGGTHDTSSNHLDAVASIDSLNNFYWTSLRKYPAIIENLHRGVFSGGNVTGIARVKGNFNILTVGWLIMDAAISYQGDKLYYCNAYFDFINNSCGTGVPCKASLGVAQKVSDTVFSKLSYSDAIFTAVNDTNYLVYAPQVTRDGLELFYTRLLKKTVNTEICVSVRKSLTDTFSAPMVIWSKFGYLPEAATVTLDKQRIYYHQKNTSGVYRLYMRYKTGITGIMDKEKVNDLVVCPNPSKERIGIKGIKPGEGEVEVYSVNGQLWIKAPVADNLDVSTLPKGLYLLRLRQDDKSSVTRFIKE